MTVTLDSDTSGPAVDTGLVRRLRTAVASDLAEVQRAREGRVQPRLSEQDEKELGAKLINDSLEHHAHQLIKNGQTPPTAEEEEALHRAVFNLLFGLGRLQPHLDRHDVVNVHAAGSQPVWLDLIDGTTVRGTPVADSDEELVEYVRELGRRVGLSERLFDPAHPRINLQLPDGSRLFAIGWVAKPTHLFLRLHRLLDVTLDDLVGLGTMSPLVRTFLGAAVRARTNLLICGGMGDGKTTLLVALEGREANVEDVGRVTCADLVRWAMRMSADRVIVGEVLGDELVPMLNAMNSGAAGSMCTLHANSSAEVFNKLALLAAQSRERLEFKHSYALAADAINFTIFIRRDRSGSRVISSIREVTGATDTGVATNELFAPDGTSRAAPTGTVLAERTRALMREHGFDPAWLARAY